MKRFLLLGLCVWFNIVWAQQPDSVIVEEEEDFSQYADAELAGGAKRFCTSKIFDQSPNKLISIGYDFQGPQTLGVQAPLYQQIKIKSVSGIRLGASVPVVSKTNILVGVGFTYWESHYQFDNGTDTPLVQELDNGLRTMGLSTTIFKPLNERNFLLVQAGADLNGNYYLPKFQSLSYLRYSGSLVYGWKKHDRLMYGFGVSRTYRAGEVNLLPIILYNYTFPSRKWGIESVFPARLALRRTFNTRTLGFIGYELEGQTYRLGSGPLINEGIQVPELRRGELRLRIAFERSLKDFIWISAQTGLRYNMVYNVDDGEFFRGFFGDQPFAIENTLSNALYFNLSINLVSP
jgi:hypothetical protein